MTKARRRDPDLPAGIFRVHDPKCPAKATGELADCRCRPRYQAQAGPRGRRLTATRDKLEEVKSWKRDVEKAFEHGHMDQPSGPTFRAEAEEWLRKARTGAVRTRSGKTYRERTLIGYEQVLALHVYPAIGDTSIEDLRRGRLNELVQDLNGRGLSAQTVKNALIPVRAVYRNLFGTERIEINPTRGIEVPAGSGRRMRILSPDEIELVLSEIDERDAALLATAFYAGLRRGELMALRWPEIDLAGGAIAVRNSFDPKTNTVTPVKSEAGQDRVVPVIASLRSRLAQHRARNLNGRGFVFARGRVAGRRVLEKDLERPFRADAVMERVAKACARIGVAPFTLHDCRHTFASLMIAAMAEAGEFDPKALQEMMGHASIQQTYDRYGKLFPGARERASGHLDAYLGRATNGASAAPQTALMRLMDAILAAGVPGDDAADHARRLIDAWQADPTLHRTTT